MSIENKNQVSARDAFLLQLLNSLSDVNGTVIGYCPKCGKPILEKDLYITTTSNIYAGDDKLNIEELSKMYCLECGEIALNGYRELNYFEYLKLDYDKCNMCVDDLNPDDPEFKLVVNYHYENAQFDKIDEEYTIKMCKHCLLQFVGQNDDHLLE